MCIFIQINEIVSSDFESQLLTTKSTCSSFSMEAGSPPPPCEGNLDGQNVNYANANIKPTQRRRRWALSLRNRASTPMRRERFKALSVSCSCKSSVKGSCMLAFSSFIELTGNLIALVYGLVYIQSACNFYAFGNDQDLSDPKKAMEYDQKLDRVLFLEKNRVGFIGLLATCLIGLVVALLIPIGTIYRSWKSLRSAMSLLLAICLAQMVFSSLYMANNELIASVAIVPFRVYEIYLIANYINYYKKKKRIWEQKQKMEMNSGQLGSATGSQNSCDEQMIYDDMMDGRMPRDSEQPTGNDVTVTLDLCDGNIIDSNVTSANNKPNSNPDEVSQAPKKKLNLFRGWPGKLSLTKSKQPASDYFRYSTYKEYDYK